MTPADQNSAKPITGPWKLSDIKQVPSNGMKVFSCFHCGGGSTMGYKLAGFEVIGGVEIDPEMMEIYRRNHSPRHSFLMGVQEFKGKIDKSLPADLFNLDILDGSPPCSSFSMAGSREDAWGDSKKFREGQADQVLDNLFFDFIEIAKKLQPKVVIAENVKGLIMGAAKGYVKEIFKSFDAAGYSAQLFLLNASRMGVPQRRERTFFIARRKDLNLPQLKLNFDEKEIQSGIAISGVSKSKEILKTKAAIQFWKKTMPGESLSKHHPKGSFFNWSKLNQFRPSPTIAANCRIMHWQEPRMLEHNEIIRLQTFPDDYDFNGLHSAYVCGMSVPPLMMQRVALEVCAQLLKK